MWQRLVKLLVRSQTQDDGNRKGKEGGRKVGDRVVVVVVVVASSNRGGKWVSRAYTYTANREKKIILLPSWSRKGSCGTRI